MKIVQNTFKTEEKFSDVPKKFGVGPKKVGSVGFPETRHFLGALKRSFKCHAQGKCAFGFSEINECFLWFF